MRTTSLVVSLVILTSPLTLSCTAFNPSGVEPGPGEPDAALAPADAAPNAPDAPGPVDAAPEPVDAPPVSPFQYVPSNFDPTALNAGSNVFLDCPARFDSTSNTFFEWCGEPEPTPMVISQPGGPDAVILAMDSLTISGASASLTLTGSRPVILVSLGDAIISGPIMANSSELVPGAGSSNESVCGSSSGQPGEGANFFVGGPAGAGGGGGGFGTPGGDGGRSTFGHEGGAAGVVGGDEALVPLRAGCAGGRGGRGYDLGAFGGIGGGAVQISAGGELEVYSYISASGAGGNSGDETNGGGGGGSGGGVLLEGDVVEVNGSAAITANGGGGGEGGDTTGCNCPRGEDGATDDETPANGGGGGSSSGGDGGDGGAGISLADDGVFGQRGSGAGGGGGGGVGRIRINAATECQILGDPLFSPVPTTNGASDCP